MRIPKIQKQITYILTLFSLTLLTLLSVALFQIFSDEQEGELFQSTEFNLQIIGGFIDSDLDEIQKLNLTPYSSLELRNYLENPNPSSFDTLLAYENLLSVLQLSTVNPYVNRLLLYSDIHNILQVGNSFYLSTSISLNDFDTELIDFYEKQDGDFLVGADSLSRYETDSLIFFQDLNILSEKNFTYLVVDLDLFFDKFTSYSLDEELLYLHINDKHFQVTSTGLIPVDIANTTQIEPLSDKKPLSESTLYSKVKTNGSDYISVSVPLFSMDGAYITHMVRNSSFEIPNRTYIVVFILAFLIIFVAAFFLITYLHRIITKPIKQICQQLSIVGTGDFTRNPEIEWENELGEIGQGINSLSSEISSLIQQKVENESEKYNLEYKILQNQISPHFIYNTLNSIKWMASIQEATGIVEMTTSLSHLLKTVAKSERELITLSNELALLKDYCTIQHYRYGDCITLEIIPPAESWTLNCLIPRFSLQPIVENSIFHGIEPNHGRGTIVVTVEPVNEGDILIRITDDGVGMTEAEIKDVFSHTNQTEDSFSSIGILNVHHRLQYIYSEKYGLKMTSKKNSFTCTEVLIPFQDKEFST